ncbi:MAG: LD-carboxypeptidase [Spirosomataceae bacterium]|jgi:muramoyltetrapeptide carboxypeptidase
MLKSPPFLNVGDRIAITAPASKIERDAIDIAIEILHSWGLKVEVGNTVGSKYFGFSDTSEKRAAEFQKYLDNPEIKLILSARGGYGCSKFADNLDFTKFLNNPKWIVGFSDITVLLMKIQSLGYQSIHGAMAKTMVYDHASNESLRNVLFGGKINYEFEINDFNRVGTTQGQAIGGNLALLAHNIGSVSDFSFDHKILFLEDIGEQFYNLDRMMLQLGRAGKLKNLSGLVLGDFSESKDNADDPFGKTIEEIIMEHVGSYHYPVAFEFPFGHENKNLAIRMGEMIKLDVNQLSVFIKSI